MVAHLSSHRRGWDDRWEEFSDWAERGKVLYEHLLALVDEDTAAFDGILAAHRMPAGDDEEQTARAEAIAAATLRAIEVPLDVMETAVAAFEVLAAMADTGLESSVSDAGVGALLAAAAVRGAGLNVRINATGLDDGASLIARAEDLERQAADAEAAVLARVRSRIEETG